MKKLQVLFETLSQAESNKLIGGFSAAYSADEGDQDSTRKTNNCHGGNYKAGCGKKNKRKYNNKYPNGNCVGNCVKGCGDAPKH